MKFAVIQTGGKQYKTTEGAILEVERINSAEGQELQFDQVLLYCVDEVCKIGQPNLEDVVVTAKVLGHVRGEKIRVGKFKAKARYRRVTGHRQALSKVQIQSIMLKGEKPAKAEAKAEKPAVEEAKAEKKTEKAKAKPATKKE
jgi:large subunit ribosomal protein L21